MDTIVDLLYYFLGIPMKENEQKKFIKPKDSKSKFITVGKRTKKVRKIAKKVIKKKVI